MKYKVTVVSTAKADLVNTYDYLHAISPEMAAVWLCEAEQTIAELGNFAGYGPAREAATLGRPLRQRVFRSHRIIFSVDEAAAIVTVVYVRHGAQRTVGEPDDPAAS